MNTSIIHTRSPEASPETTHRRWHGVIDTPSLPCWTTPETYIAACYLAITTEQGADLRKRLGYVSVESVMNVVVEDCKTADRLTGKNVMTSHATVSRRLLAQGVELSESVVKRARQVIERLGLSGTVVEGRHLSAEERALHRAEGRKQIVIASTRHLLVPRMWADALEQARRVPTTYQSIKSFFYRLSSDSPRQNRPRRKRKTQKTAPAPLPYRKLAAKLAQRLPWLARLPYLGGVARILMNAGLDPQHWTAHDLINVIDAHRTKLGWNTPGTVKNPHGWLKFLLSGLTGEVIEAHVRLRERLADEVEARRRSALSAAPRKAPSPSEVLIASKGLALVRAVLKAKKSNRPLPSLPAHV